MSKSVTSETWARLRRDRQHSDESMTTEPIGATTDDQEILLAVDSNANLHLLIPVVEGPKDTRIQDLQGLRVRHKETAQQNCYLDLEASGAHESLFCSLIEDILSAVQSHGRDPWKAVRSIIRQRQSAWRQAIPELPKNVQVGLFGELLILERVMIPALGTDAIEAWSGPYGERHDFVTANTHVEVKTTRKSRHEHEISRVDQLSVPTGKELLVASILLEESLQGAANVATKMDDVIDLIRSDPSMIDLFMAKMVKIGWMDDLRWGGSLLQFNIKEAYLYEVNSRFPRLPDDFKPPNGVTAMKYTIDLANLPFIDVDEAISLLKV